MQVNSYTTIPIQKVEEKTKVTYSYYQTYHVTLAYGASSYCSFPYIRTVYHYYTTTKEDHNGAKSFMKSNWIIFILLLTTATF